MKLSVEQLIKGEAISPFFWGMNEADIRHLWPHAAAAIRECRQSQCPLLYLDEVEFYFREDFYQGLNQVIIKVWACDPTAQTQYFDLDWINKRVTLKAAREILSSRGWEYEEGQNPGYEAPLLMVEKRAVFLFEDAEDGNRLEKIVIYSPEDAPRRYQTLLNMKQR